MIGSLSMTFAISASSVLTLCTKSFRFVARMAMDKGGKYTPKGFTSVLLVDS